VHAECHLGILSITGVYAWTQGSFFGVCRNFGLLSPMADPQLDWSNPFVAEEVRVE